MTSNFFGAIRVLIFGTIPPALASRIVTSADFRGLSVAVMRSEMLLFTLV